MISPSRLVILNDSWAISIRLPIGSFAKRGEVAGRTVDSGFGVRDMARRRPEVLDVDKLGIVSIYSKLSEKGYSPWGVIRISVDLDFSIAIFPFLKILATL